MTFTVRPETPSDAPAIDAVVTTAFLSAPHRSGTEAAIVRALRDAGALALSLVAVADGELIGHVAASPVTISSVPSGWYGLGPVAVLPQEQGRGVGSRLVEQALRRLRQQGAAGCVLVGEPAFYSRFGFAARPGLVLEGVPPAYFQALSFDGARPRAPCASTRPSRRVPERSGGAVTAACRATVAAGPRPPPAGLPCCAAATRR